MSAAINARGPRERAAIAASILKTTKPWPAGRGLGRNFDDCLEMGDGDAVMIHLIAKAMTDTTLVDAMRRHGLGTWTAMVDAAIAAAVITPWVMKEAA